MNISIIHSNGNPPGKLADVELQFTDGDLQGLKLVGFVVWEKPGNQRTVTFPARQYSVNGERRSFRLLRPTWEADASDRLTERILQAYAEMEKLNSVALR